jgi:hypothetical protein
MSKKSKGLFITGVLDSLTPAVPLDHEVNSRNRLQASLGMHIIWIKSIYIRRVVGAWLCLCNGKSYLIITACHICVVVYIEVSSDEGSDCS